jgi:hypothetical protein
MVMEWPKAAGGIRAEVQDINALWTNNPEILKTTPAVFFLRSVKPDSNGFYVGAVVSFCCRARLEGRGSAQNFATPSEGLNRTKKRVLRSAFKSLLAECFYCRVVAESR